MQKKIIKIDKKTGDFLVYTPEEYTKIEQEDDLQCSNCLRIIPNESFFTKHGCIWCDMTYYKRRHNETKKKIKKTR